MSSSQPYVRTVHVISTRTTTTTDDEHDASSRMYLQPWVSRATENPRRKTENQRNATRRRKWALPLPCVVDCDFPALQTPTSLQPHHPQRPPQEWATVLQIETLRMFFAGLGCGLGGVTVGWRGVRWGLREGWGRLGALYMDMSTTKR